MDDLKWITGQWIKNPSRTICSQIVFYQNPIDSRIDSRLKNSEKIKDRQTGVMKKVNTFEMYTLLASNKDKPMARQSLREVSQFVD
jgi:hypothetical protein